MILSEQERFAPVLFCIFCGAVIDFFLKLWDNM